MPRALVEATRRIGGGVTFLRYLPVSIHIPKTVLFVRVAGEC
jgi:hypothetical protein